MTEQEKPSYDGRASSGESKGPEQLNFHYDREERLKGLSFDYPRGKTRGVFRNNKGLVFILIDVFILLLIGFIFVPFMRGRLSSETWKGYQIELEATSFDDMIYAKLTITDSGDGEFPGEMVEVEFIYGDEIVGESFTEFFPEPGTPETAIRTSYPVIDGVSKVDIRITHMGEFVSLRGKVR